MLKHVVVCFTLVLLVGASAQGSILQGQNVAIGTGNAIQLVQQAQQNAQGTQNVFIDLTQESEGGSGLMLARAYTFGFTGQIGGLGVSSLLGVSQIGLIRNLSAGSLLIPSAGGAQALLMRARLNSLLLMAR